MRPLAVLLLTLSLVGSAGCGAVLGDFTMGSGDGGELSDAETDGSGQDGTLRGDGAADSASDGGTGPDGSGGADGAGDGNDGGPPVALAFVSSATYGGASLTSPQGADQRCDVLAQAQGLGPGFHAWVSDMFSPAPSRMNLTATPVKLLDGTTVVDAGTDLYLGSLVNAIRLTEKKDDIGGENVWTGTKSDGSSAGPTETCGEWNTPTAVQGLYGDSSRTDDGWTQKGDDDCSNEAHLYCFGPAN